MDQSPLCHVVHDLSARRDGPFVEVGLTSEVGTDNLIQSNLFGHVRGAFTGADEEKQGLFALADGGTIFLDEIGDATPELQANSARRRVHRFHRWTQIREEANRGRSPSRLPICLNLCQSVDRLADSKLLRVIEKKTFKMLGGVRDLSVLSTATRSGPQIDTDSHR